MKTCTATEDLGGGLKVKMWLEGNGLMAEWDPTLPKKLTKDQLERYRRCRDELVLELTKEMGGERVMIIET